MLKHYHDKGLLGWLDSGMTPSSHSWNPPLLGLNYETYIKHKNLLPTPENLRLGPDISQGPVVVIVTISFAIISHILYRPMSHLQFNL